jgi:hypothetical protein
VWAIASKKKKKTTNRKYQTSRQQLVAPQTRYPKPNGCLLEGCIAAERPRLELGYLGLTPRWNHKRSLVGTLTCVENCYMANLWFSRALPMEHEQRNGYRRHSKGTIVGWCLIATIFLGDTKSFSFLVSCSLRACSANPAESIESS